MTTNGEHDELTFLTENEVRRLLRSAANELALHVGDADYSWINARVTRMISFLLLLEKFHKHNLDMVAQDEGFADHKEKCDALDAREGTVEDTSEVPF